MAPLPKGGWHGKAVPGGFLSRTPCNPSVGTGFYPTRPCQVIRIFVGADASVRPPTLYRTSCKRCHCETSSQTGRGNPHPPVPSAPLPKEGWHGESVPGGYISVPHFLYPLRRAARPTKFYR